ncbi:MAG: hypothetical protein KAK00_06095 [Nanoarchaeota archaeon]|nr:hypothetical protein [Nanoarchaeota archaeon]
METKRKLTIEKNILMVPLLLSFLWLGFLVLDVQNPDAGIKLSPTKLDSMVNALFAFIVVYALVLVIVFYKMNKSIKKEPKKPKKKNK